MSDFSHLLATASTDDLNRLTGEAAEELQRRARVNAARISHQRAVHEARTNAGPVVLAEPVPADGHAPGQAVSVGDTIYRNDVGDWLTEPPPSHGWTLIEPEPEDA